MTSDIQNGSLGDFSNNVSTHEPIKNLTNQTCDGIQCYPDSVFHAATILTIILAIFGAFGNILTVLAIVTSRLRNNTNSILICQLSVAEMMYCLLLMPLIATTFYYRTWILTPFMCELHAALRIWLIGVIMGLLSTIAVYRLLYVVHPINYLIYSRSQWFLGACILCWAQPFIFSIAPLVGWWGEFSFQQRILQCTFSTMSNKSHKTISLTTGYLVPCLFIFFCYARIGFVVSKSRTKVSKGINNRLTFMMMLIFLGFLIGTTPFFITSIVDKKLAYPMPHIWTPFLAWVMYGMNPIIYTIIDPNFRQAYQRLLLCRIFKHDNVDQASVSEACMTDARRKGATVGEMSVADSLNSLLAARKSVENSLSTKNVEKSPSPKRIENRPSPKSVENSRSPKRVEKSPSPKRVKSSPSSKSVEKSPSPKRVKKSPSPKRVKSSPSSKSVENSPSPKSVENSPSPKSVENSPSPKSVENSPSPKSVESSPSSKSVENSSSPKRVKNSPSPK